MKLFVYLLFPLHFDTLPPTDQLHQALQTFQDRSLTAQLAEYDDSNKGQWMNYVPAVGIGYTPSGQPRPTVSFSLSQVLSASRRRADIKAKRQAVQQASALTAEQAHAHLDELVKKHRLLKLELETMRQVSEIDAQIFALAQADYDAAKIPPSQFLPKQKSYLEAQLSLTRKEIELQFLEAEILAYCNLNGLH